jgi:plastocyanin
MADGAPAATSVGVLQATLLLWAVFVTVPFRIVGGPAEIETASPVPSASVGSVEGLVSFRGEILKSATPDDAGARRDLLEVDRDGGLRYVVAWLVTDQTAETERLAETAPSPTSTSAPALMDQRGHEFVPRVLAVRAGQPVKFTNSDPANHNVRTTSFQRTNEFNVYTGIDGSYTHRFAADPQQRPVRVGCDIHPWMRGWIYVFDHPHFAVTDARGRCRLEAVPPGRYTLHLRQPDLRYAAERKLTVVAGEVTKLGLEIRAEQPPLATE